MDAKIYDLLNKIHQDNLVAARFGLSRNIKTFLKELLLDENTLNYFIEKSGGTEKTLSILQSVFDNLVSINDEIASLSSSSDEDKEKYSAIISVEFISFEQEKDALIEKEIKNRIAISDISRTREEDFKKYNEILDELNSSLNIK